MKSRTLKPNELAVTETGNPRQRLGQPSWYHARLDPLIGEWQIAMTVWPDGSEEPLYSDQITAQKVWVNGGLHVREDVRGPFAGGQHEKVTVLGYNNVRQRYEYVTADNSDTVIVTYYGQLDANGQSITFSGEYAHPGEGSEVTGSLITIRAVLGIESSMQHRLTIYYRRPAQDERRFLEYVYTRVS